MGKNGFLNIFVILIVGLIVGTMIFFILKNFIRTLKKKINYLYIKDISINSLDALSGDEFEDYLYYLFSYMGFKVQKTQKTRDFGADLIIEHNNTTICIQAKLYYNHSVGTSAIQEVYSATQYYGTNSALVITNSYFTSSARTLAEKTNVILIDRDNLNKIITTTIREKKPLSSQLFLSIMEKNISQKITN